VGSGGVAQGEGEGGVIRRGGVGAGRGDGGGAGGTRSSVGDY